MLFEQVLARGDSGEQVTQVQEWLRQLGHYEGTVDGEFGEATETALHRFQESAGFERDGQVQEHTWQTLELHAGHQDNGGHHEYAEQGQERQWSEDGKWWWDGAEWQEAEGHAEAHHAEAHHEATAEAVGVGQLSEDGHWRWDGQNWLVAGTEPAAQHGGAQAQLLGFDQPAGEAEELQSRNRPRARTQDEARALVDAHVEPKRCFIELESTRAGWRPITGTGCAHWVAHQRGAPTGQPNACQAGFKYRVTEVLGSLTQVSANLSGAQVGQVWSAPAGQSHIGIVRAVNRDPKTNAVVSVDVENDSSASGGVVTQTKTDGSVYH